MPLYDPYKSIRAQTSHYTLNPYKGPEIPLHPKTKQGKVRVTWRPFIGIHVGLHLKQSPTLGLGFRVWGLGAAIWLWVKEIHIWGFPKTKAAFFTCLRCPKKAGL